MVFTLISVVLEKLVRERVWFRIVFTIISVFKARRVTEFCLESVLN